MNRAAAWICGALTGASAAYFFDPDRGRRRRALLRDRFRSSTRRMQRECGRTWRDVMNRTEGYLHEAANGLRDQPVSDTTLAARVRSRLGRCVSHPAAVAVSVQNGCVHLSGPVLTGEVECLLSGVRAVRGVRHIEHDLELHDRAEHFPALEGGRRRQAARPNLLEEHWAPSTRALVGSAGVALMSSALLQDRLLAVLYGAAGGGLLMRALTPDPAAAHRAARSESGSSPIGGRPAHESGVLPGAQSKSPARLNNQLQFE